MKDIRLFFLCSLIFICFIAVIAFFLIYWPIKTLAYIFLICLIAVLVGNGIKGNFEGENSEQ